MNRLQSLLGSARSWDGLDLMQFGGNTYPLFNLNQTLGGKVEEIDVGYTSLVWRAYQQNAIVFACIRARMMLFTEARFQFQTLRGGRPGDYFGNERLRILETPWPGATTGDLLKYMLIDADLAGNAFVARVGSTLKRLRPDWTRIIHGSPNPDGSMWDPESELIGYSYQPGGPSGGKPWVFFDATEVAHFAPIPDPLTSVRGMSWLSPIVREIMGDQAMTEHKIRFHENGGTPNIVISTGYTDIGELQKFMQFFRQNHAGTANAYKAMGLTAGVDVKVVGADLQQIDFKVVQGAGETRIAAAAGVPPAVAGISEGLQGSSLNAGNFQAAMRMFADLTMRPLWRNVAGSLERIVPPGAGSRLWYDDRDVPALKDDIKDAAEVRALDSTAMRTLRDGGWDPDAVVSFIVSGDPKVLIGKHDGTKPVQQQPAGSTPAEPTNGKAPDSTSGRSMEDLVVALYQANRMSQPQLPAPVRFEEGAIHVEVHAPEPAPPPNITIGPPPPAEVTVNIEPPPPAEVNVTIPSAEPPSVTFAEGAFMVAAPPPAEVTVNVEPPPPAQITVEAPPPSEVTVNIEAPVPMATVLDFDPVTGDVTGEHQVPLV